MKKITLIGLSVALAATITSAIVVAGSLASLRGTAAITEPSVTPLKARVINDKENIERTFEEQPPVVPHKTDKYTVNLRENKCLDCHSKETAKEKEASEVSESHYETRDGKKLGNLAARRYFCEQCHVPQVDAPPLIENVFEGYKLSKSQ